MGEPSSVIRQRVQAARDIQTMRFANIESSNIACPVLEPGLSQRRYVQSLRMGIAEIRKFCALDEASSPQMKFAMTQMNLSARAYHRLLKLARTMHSTMSPI
jgi:magnesium chelatase family protein